MPSVAAALDSGMQQLGRAAAPAAGWSHRPDLGLVSERSFGLTWRVKTNGNFSSVEAWMPDLSVAAGYYSQAC